MGKATTIRTPRERDVHIRARAAERLADTPFDPKHPAVVVALNWQALRKSANSAAGCVANFAPFFAYCSDNGIDPLELTRPQARRFIAEQERLDYAPQTIANRLVTLRSYYVELEDEGLVTSNPFYRIKAGNHDPVTPTPSLTAEQCDQLIAMAGARTRSGSGTIWDHRNAAMAYVMVRLGPRRFEVAAATWGDIRRRAAGHEWNINGKGNRWAGVVLTDDVLSVIEDWRAALDDVLNRRLRDDDPLFPSIPPLPQSGVLRPKAATTLRHMAERQVSRIFKGLLADVGIEGPRYSAHAARATAATLAYAATRDVVAVQKLLRHRNQATTLGYIKQASVESAAAAWQPAAAPPVRAIRRAEETDAA